jgi:outer membrane protein OmpU
MKKFLLATTALVGFVATSAMADAPTITLGGGVDFQAGFSSQKKAYKAHGDHAAEASTKFAVNSSVSIKAEGKTDYGLTYGGMIQIKGDNTHNKYDNVIGANLGDQLYVRRAFVYVDSGFGRMEAGSNDSATLQMEVGPNKFARGSDGIDGDWSSYVNTTAGYTDGTNTNAAKYITSAHLPFDSGHFDSGVNKHANKVTYFTPKISGFQFGTSFTPQTNQSGTAKSFTNPHSGATTAARNLVNVSLGYENKFDQVGVAANLSGAFGKAVEVRNPSEAQKVRDVKAYSAGLAVSYANFTVGGSIGDFGKSLNYKTATDNTSAKAGFYTLGAAYENGPLGLSAGYLNGKQHKNKSTVLSVSADYSLAPGFTPYIEGNLFKLTPAAGVLLNNAQAPAQKGNVIIVGTKFNF